jgi:hypothetical protein
MPQPLIALGTPSVILGFGRVGAPGSYQPAREHLHEDRYGNFSDAWA